MGTSPNQPKRDKKSNLTGLGSSAGGNQPKEVKKCPIKFTTKLAAPSTKVRLKKGDELKIIIQDKNIHLLRGIVSVFLISGKTADRLIYCSGKNIHYEARVSKINPYVIAFIRN